jgi:hypothetical protein
VSRVTGGFTESERTSRADVSYFVSELASEVDVAASGSEPLEMKLQVERVNQNAGGCKLNE